METITMKKKELQKFFDRSLIVPKHLCQFLHLELDTRPIDPYLNILIQEIKQKGVTDQDVLDVFKVVDRKYFMNNDIDAGNSINSLLNPGRADRNFNPYGDVPRPIGWNTTISAPSMHAFSLKHLMSHLKTATKILDIGTGSGFMTAAMAFAAPA